MPGKALQALRYRLNLVDSGYRLGWWPVAARGSCTLRGVVVSDGVKKKMWSAIIWRAALGWCRISNCPYYSDEVRAGRVVTDQFQLTTQSPVFCAGETTGIGGVELSLVEGEIAGLASAGRQSECDRLLEHRLKLRAFAGMMDRRSRCEVN